jgi:hypothetical protein
LASVGSATGLRAGPLHIFISSLIPHLRSRVSLFSMLSISSPSGALNQPLEHLHILTFSYYETFGPKGLEPTS